MIGVICTREQLRGYLMDSHPPLQVPSDPTPSAFDFRAFLDEFDPTHAYSVTPCSGGLINFTVRAVRDKPTAACTSVVNDNDNDKTVLGCSMTLPGSLVLKHSPPFVATLGESMPFSQERQVSPAISHLTTGRSMSNSPFRRCLRRPQKQMH